MDALEPVDGWISDSGLAAGDLDGDGLTDAAVVSGYTIDLFLQRAGTLTVGRTIRNPGYRWLETADVDGDGRVDLVGNGPAGVGFLRNLGGATFADPVVLTPAPQLDVQVGDVTGDGRRDIVSSYGTIGAVLVFAQLPGGGFAPPTEHRGDVVALSLALADVNGDGRTDVSFVGGGNRPRTRLDVLLRRGDGTLAPPVTYPTNDIPEAVRPGDTNADGRTDLVVVHAGWSAVGVHAQGPTGTLDPERLYPMLRNDGPSPSSLDVGDVNGDGRADIVIADILHGLVVLLGQPAGPSTTTSTFPLAPNVPYGGPGGYSRPPAFGPLQTYGLGGQPESVVAGDFNGDGRGDLATLTRPGNDPGTSEKVFLLLQGTDGSLHRAVRFDTDALIGNIGLNESALALAAGDVDGDGLDDLVVRMMDGINVFLQRSGTFADRTYIEMARARRADIADFDGDGMGDLVMSGRGIRVHRSLGGGAFAPPVTVDDRTNSDQVAIDDMDGDGRLDIVMVEDFPNDVVVYRQLANQSFAAGVRTAAGGQYGSVATGGFTGDGRRDVAVSHSLEGGAVERIRILAQGADGALTPVDELVA